MRDFLRRLFCRHQWVYSVHNLMPDEGAPVITIGFHCCHKCGSWKWDFVYDNQPRNAK